MRELMCIGCNWRSRDDTRNCVMKTRCLIKATEKIPAKINKYTCTLCPSPSQDVRRWGSSSKKKNQAYRPQKKSLKVSMKTGPDG